MQLQRPATATLLTDPETTLHQDEDQDLSDHLYNDNVDSMEYESERESERERESGTSPQNPEMIDDGTEVNTSEGQRVSMPRPLSSSTKEDFEGHDEVYEIQFGQHKR